MSDGKEPAGNQVQLDFDRENRTGLGEAVFCAGKSVEQLVSICEKLEASDRRMLFTRMDPEVHEALEKLVLPDFLEYDALSRTAFHGPVKVRTDDLVAVVTGGTSDTGVAREAARSLEFYGHGSLKIDDVGVAGLWRITERLEELRQRKIVICVAGMDAALPTVLGGLIPASIIAVPTSVGYGMARNGETALHALLVSCASGLVVVNIDNGYGAACAALRMINMFSPPA